MLKSGLHQLRLVVYPVYPIIYRVSKTSQVVVWDFWIINSLSGKKFQNNKRNTPENSTPKTPKLIELGWKFGDGICSFLVSMPSFQGSVSIPLNIDSGFIIDKSIGGKNHAISSVSNHFSETLRKWVKHSEHNCFWLWWSNHQESLEFFIAQNRSIYTYHSNIKFQYSPIIH